MDVGSVLSGFLREKEGARVKTQEEGEETDKAVVKDSSAQMKILKGEKRPPESSGQTTCPKNSGNHQSNTVKIGQNLAFGLDQYQFCW